MTLGSDKKNILRVFNIILITALLLFGFAAGLAADDDWIAPKVSHEVALEDGWTRINPDGTEEAVSGRFSIGKTVPITFYRTLPEVIDSDQILRIKCPYTTVDAYVDGVSIYHAGPAKMGPVSTTVGNVFALIPLDSSYAGKEIRITVEPRHYQYEVLIKDAAITTMAEYSVARLVKAVPYFALCMVISIISIMSLVLFINLKITTRNAEIDLTKGFLHLALFGFCVVAWIISDYHIIGMMTGRMVLSGLINYITFMLCPFMFSGILVYIFGKKPFFMVVFIAAETNFVIQMILFLTGIADLPDGLIISQSFVAILIIGMIYFGYLLLGKYIRKDIWVIVIPAIGFMFFALWAALVYTRNGEWMLYVAIAMTFYVFTVIAYLMMNLMEIVRKNLKFEHVKKIAYIDNLTQLENRQAYGEYLQKLEKKLEKGELDEDLSVVMLDVNGLKKTNDIYGHEAGDELITGSANCIKEAFGEVGRCFRTGGDEFVVIAFMDHELFLKKSEALENSLANWHGEYINGISISLGKADSREFPKESIKSLIGIADKRMYENKQHYYAGQIEAAMEADETDDNITARRMRYGKRFTVTKYTMPLVRQIAEIIPGGFFIYREDEERELLYLNTRTLEIYGCKNLEEFIELTGNTFKGMVYPEDFNKIQLSIDHQIDAEAGNGMDHVIYRIKRKDGEIRWVDDYGHYGYSQDFGDLYYVFITDITYKYRIE